MQVQIHIMQLEIHWQNTAGNVLYRYIIFSATKKKTIFALEKFFLTDCYLRVIYIAFFNICSNSNFQPVPK